MKSTDIIEKALEQLIVRHLAGISEHPGASVNTVTSLGRSMLWVVMR